MSTRSRIGIIINPEASYEEQIITSIYCHHDGYIKSVGEKLKAHYNNIDKINQLLELGDISALAETVEDTAKEAYDDLESAFILRYKLKEFIQVCEQYNYIFDGNSRHAYDHNMKKIDL